MRSLYMGIGILISFAFADPFVNMEDAVGYIIVERNGKSENYVVFETKDGEVELVKIGRDPSKVLEKEKGGKRR